MILIALQSMLQPSVNALSLSMETKEEAVNFAAARGTGSVAYALSSFAAGRLLAHFDPGILPWLYLAVQLALIAVLWTVRTEGEAPERGMREEKLRKQGNLPYRIMLRTYPHLRLFVPGMICLFCTYSFIDSFLIQIVLSIGGTNADLGTAITAGAILEFPAMLLYAWLCRKKLGMKVFRISIWIWLVKDVLTAFAGSTSALFAVQMMGVACCAIYVPGMMHYMRTSLPPGLLLRGATLAGTATTVGSLIAALTGGWLIDHAGVHRALLLSLIPAALGAWLMDRAIGRAARQTVGEALIKAFPAP